MVRLSHSFEGCRGTLLGWFAWALCGCAAPLVGAQSPGGSAASAISSITIERDCFGCSTGSLLVLRRDGTATHTLTGKARHGTEDKLSRGTVRVEDFEALARVALSQGFFEMNDRYEDPQSADGAWTTTTITRGAQDKQVFRRDSAGPVAMAKIEASVEALKAQIKFIPAAR